MFIVTRIWISISDLDLNSIIESHNENLKNLVNFIIVIKITPQLELLAGVSLLEGRPEHSTAGAFGRCIFYKAFRLLSSMLA